MAKSKIQPQTVHRRTRWLSLQGRIHGVSVDEIPASAHTHIPTQYELAVQFIANQSARMNHHTAFYALRVLALHVIDIFTACLSMKFRRQHTHIIQTPYKQAYLDFTFLLKSIQIFNTPNNTRSSHYSREYVEALRAGRMCTPVHNQLCRSIASVQSSRHSLHPEARTAPIQ